MKGIIRFFKQKWVISVIGLLALIVLVWFGGPLIAVAGSVPLGSVVARLVAVLVIVLIWGLNNLRKQIQAKRADSQIIGGMVEAAPAAPVGGEPDQSAEEVAALKERFDEAMAVLRKSGGKGGARSLYELPWYIIIGPPGSGKTTALINSGLDFPLADRFGKEALRGVGGTRNCDWWFTNEAVLLDTAGRYVTQDSHAEVDSAAWGGFLSLLKKHRRRRPINGVLVAISLADLITQSEAERAAHVRAIKQRIQELNKHLGIRFPVYVLFTKCDLVAGFMEFFDDLGRDERAQVWGTTFPMDDGTGVVQKFGPEFDLLVQRLNDRLFWRLNQERDLQRRSLTYGFPNQMSSLKETIDTFLQEVFRPSRFEEPTLLRGVYFTSGTQEGTPIDRLMGSLARTFGLDQQSLPSYGGHGRSYFITNLLRGVVFQEVALAGANQRFERQRAWIQRGAYAGAVIATILAGLAWSTSFTRNQVYVNRMQDKVAAYRKVAAAPLPPDADFADALPRLDALRAATQVYGAHQDGRPFMMGLGLYQGDKLGGDAEAAYHRELNKVLLPRIAARLEQQLRSVNNDPDFEYEALKTYLMLGEPDHLDTDQIKLWMGIDWANTYPGDTAQQARLKDHLDALLAAGIQPVALNQSLVANVRAQLNQIPLAQLAYGRFKREYAASDTNPFRITDAAGSGATQVFTRASGVPLSKGISGLYTYRGFYQVFETQSRDFVKQMRKDSWVLGTGNDSLGKAELGQLDKDMRALYVDDYIHTWDQLLGDVRIVPFHNIQQGVQVLGTLSGPSSPMRGLLQAVDRNTDLNKLPGGMQAAAKKAGELAAAKSRLARLFSSAEGGNKASGPTLPGDAVTQHFERLDQLAQAPGGTGTPPMENIINQLSDLYGYLNGLSGGNALTAASGGSGSDILQRLEIEAARQPQPVQSWLQQLVASSRAVTMGGARSQLNAMYTSTVLPDCNAALGSRFPLNPRGKQEVTLTDFGRFFGPGGTMDDFFQKQLKPFVDTSHANWRWKSDLGIPNSVLRQFQRAELIRETFFAGSGQQPLVRFGLKPVYLDAGTVEFELDIDGQKFIYRHGPTRTTNAQWPGPNGPSGARISFEDANGGRSTVNLDGAWAWFKLLDQSKIKQLSADRFLITFESGGHKAQYELHASSVINPFRMKDVQDFSCPGSL